MIVSIIVTLLVLGLIWWLISFLPIPAPFGQIIQVLFIILAILAVLSVFGVGSGLGIPVIKL